MKRFIEEYDLQEQLGELPEANREVLLSTPWQEQVFEITQKQGFLVDEAERIIKEVGLVLVGVMPAHDLQKNLIDEAGLSEKESNVMVRELNAFVFMPMREKILSYQKKAEGGLKRDTLLNEIESINTPKPPAGESMVRRKLESLFHAPPQTTDHSLSTISARQDTINKNTSLAPVKVYDGHDPYHEPIE